MTAVRRTGRGTRPLLRSCVLVLLGCLVLVGCGARGSDGPAANGVLGDDTTFYVNPQGTAVQAVAALRAEGDTEAARTLREGIARHPSATWLTPVPNSVFAQARGIAEAAEDRDAMPVLVAYNLPERDCGQYSSGGAADIDAYLTWLGSLAAGIGDHRAVVILEPDAVAHSLDGCSGSSTAEERYRLLAEAVKILKRQPQVRVYIDAGNPGWIKDLDALASALKASGIAKADGFALNVSNFESTERNLAYGEKISERLDDAHFVVDTSRNGAGAPPEEDVSSTGHSWCNPPGRRLGTPATTRTDHPLADAYLWIKQPGDSDGTCVDGAPAAGVWWPEHAADLLGDGPQQTG